MNSQNFLYNISLTPEQVEEVMGALADKANSLAGLQKNIYTQALEQRTDMENMLKATQQATEVVEVVEEKPKSKKGASTNDGTQDIQ